MRFVIAAILSSALAAANPVRAAELAAHHAQYDLTLERGRGEVIAVSGSMEYNVTDACDAWAVRQRLRMRLTGADGSEVEMLSDYSTIERKDGSSLRFRLRQTNAGEPPSEIAGNATVGSDGGQAVYTSPEPATKPLPAGTLLPMRHTEAIIAAAKAGKKFIALPIFDGTGTDGAQNSAIAIASWGPPRPGAPPGLETLESGRMRIAFFGRQATGPQAEYEVGMRYYENGVADEMSMDFGDFVVAAKLHTLELSKPGC